MTQTINDTATSRPTHLDAHMPHPPPHNMPPSTINPKHDLGLFADSYSAEELGLNFENSSSPTHFNDVLRSYDLWSKKFKEFYNSLPSGKNKEAKEDISPSTKEEKEKLELYRTRLMETYNNLYQQFQRSTIPDKEPVKRNTRSLNSEGKGSYSQDGVRWWLA